MFLQYPRYQNLKGVTDYKQACRLIKADGWATDVRYTEKLISLIEKYGLDKYDEEVLEVVEKDKVEVFGKVVTMKLIRKDGRVYPDIREFCEAVGLEIDNKGRMPVVKK